jgi:L-ribulose-5-phosphate 3-epimerase
MTELHAGVRAHDFGKLPIEELGRRVREKGFTAIQLALAKSLPGIGTAPGFLSPGFANHVRDALARHGVTIAVLGCYINPIHPDPEIRRRELARFTEHLRFARDFGCSVVATETGSRAPDCSYHPETETEEALEEFIGVIRGLVSTAERFGVTVGIEGVAGQHTISTQERMVRVLEAIDSPNLGVVYDPVNFLPVERTVELQEDSIEGAFERFGDRIVTVHAKDFTVVDGRKKGDLPAGTGLLNWNLLFRLLKKRKPMMHVLLENTTPETMDRTLRFVREAYRNA